MIAQTKTLARETGSQDVAHDKSSLESYGVTHILNLDADVANKFEDDYNYKNIHIQDNSEYNLDKILDECFDFIDDGRHYGNVLVHCAGAVGLSRSTTICVAYLMKEEKQKFDEAFNNVKEARAFVKPNEGFIKQLKDYEVKLRGAQQVKDSGIDDPFALRKKQEIEQEKAMVAGAASVKNRMKMFGATLDAGAAPRSKSVSPSPYKSQQEQASSPAASKPASKWAPVQTNNTFSSSNSNESKNKAISKSMTPEPRRPSWSQQQHANKQPTQTPGPSGPPPPPPPPPAGSLLRDTGSAKSSAAPAPPPPPPPPPAFDKDVKPLATSSSGNKQQPSDGPAERSVFGRVPPPPTKIKGGMSIERSNDSERSPTLISATSAKKASTTQ